MIPEYCGFLINLLLYSPPPARQCCRLGSTVFTLYYSSDIHANKNCSKPLITHFYIRLYAGLCRALGPTVVAEIRTRPSSLQSVARIRTCFLNLDKWLEPLNGYNPLGTLKGIN